MVGMFKGDGALSIDEKMCKYTKIVVGGGIIMRLLWTYIFS